MDTLLIKNIYAKVLELSDENLQRKLWLNAYNDTGLISSYTELMCTLFNDYDFDIFVDNTAKKFDIQDSVIYELSKLRDELNDYEEKENDREIINDPKWQKIIRHAQNIVDMWELKDGIKIVVVSDSKGKGLEKK